jgi:hypothetical protein
MVKTATKGFPRNYLTNVELHQCGNFLALASDPTSYNEPSMAALEGMDCKRRYFIARAGSLAEGTPYSGCCWRQVNQQPNAPPEEVTMSIQQPQIAEAYYSTYAAIDRYNRYCQDDLRIEKKIETNDWSVCVNLSIIAMIVVDTWLDYNAFKNIPQFLATAVFTLDLVFVFCFIADFFQFTCAFPFDCEEPRRCCDLLRGERRSELPEGEFVGIMMCSKVLQVNGVCYDK